MELYMVEIQRINWPIHIRFLYWKIRYILTNFFSGFGLQRNPLNTCGRCAGTIIKAIVSCNIGDIICIAFKSGICIGCKCKIIAALALPWIDPFCDGLSQILGWSTKGNKSQGKGQINDLQICVLGIVIPNTYRMYLGQAHEKYLGYKISHSITLFW